MITGIVVALKEEAATLTAKRFKKGCIAYLTDEIWVVCSGAGEENARQASELLVEMGANRLISWGCAAALDAALHPGHLVLANSCIDGQQVLFDLDNTGWVADILSHFEGQIPVHRGRIAESNKIVETSIEKAHVGDLTGAIALDMESTAIAKVAYVNEIPFITIRVIADSLSMELPKAVSYAVNEHGEVILRKLLLHLVKRPNELPELIKLGIAFNAAKKTLKRLAKELEIITRYGAIGVGML